MLGAHTAWRDFLYEVKDSDPEGYHGHTLENLEPLLVKLQAKFETSPGDYNMFTFDSNIGNKHITAIAVNSEHYDSVVQKVADLGLQDQIEVILTAS